MTRRYNLLLSLTLLALVSLIILPISFAQRSGRKGPIRVENDQPGKSRPD